MERSKSGNYLALLQHCCRFLDAGKLREKLAKRVEMTATAFVVTLSGIYGVVI